MQTIYSLIESYFNLFVYLYGFIFSDRDTLMSFAIFSGFLPVMGIPKMLFGGERSESFAEWFITSAPFAFLITLGIYLTSHFFELWSGGYAFWGFIVAVGGGLFWQRDVTLISQSVKKGQE